MRFSCQVKVVNRACSGQHQPRSKRSTISIGGYGKTDSGSSLYILHQTPQDPAGVRYKISGDTKIADSFAKKGTVTVRLSNPPLDLLIAGSPSDAVKLAEIIKNCTTNPGVPAKKLKLTNLESVPKKCDPMPQKELVIDSNKKHRLIKSYPSSLENLKVTSAELENIDPRILRLQHLKVLTITNNRLRSLPKSIYLLYNLVTLDLSGNELGFTTKADDWDWTRSLSLCTSLKTLNLSSNKIRMLPDSICNIKTLVELNASANELVTLPNHLGLIRSLRILILEKNQLRWLPISLTWLTYEYFDVTDNPLMDQLPPQSLETFEINLKALSASAVLSNRIAVDEMTLPRELIRVLEGSCFCHCKKPTFPSTPTHFTSKRISTSGSHIMNSIAPMPLSTYFFGFRHCGRGNCLNLQSR
ncbi:Hypothetical protein NTJ_05857 [Nesidiocoris tenuis]|uniref:PIF1/LRR1 pleckstrin homology domain-containing protein n=1 Tax=Nesidiocoris tenuis TaxID=355587 RepID=A0ABN7ALY3_9HEMI|nr:Hypothetical protein NTJ_05857 [Nesidiocoris tenuis]